MSDERDNEHDEARLPPDPAGTQPKVRASSLLPARIERKPEPTDEEVASALPDRIEHNAPVAAAPLEEAPHAAKFQFILGALIAIGIVGLASLALLAGNGSKAEGPEWSAWSPGEDGGDGAQEIADHVGPQYRLPTGEQLVLVKGGEMELQDLPLSLAMRDNEGDVEILKGDAVLYQLCGLGPKCAINKGRPSEARHLLLRREALELALYSFRYLRGVDQVVVQLPPRMGQEPDQALFFQKGDVGRQLDAPELRTVLPMPTPTVKNVAKVKNAELINQLTSRGLFTFTYTQSQDASLYLVLEPYDPTAVVTPSPDVQQGSGGGEGEGPS